MFTWLTLISWLALLVAAIVAALRGVFSERALAAFETIRSFATAAIAFLGWVGISGALNARIRGWFITLAGQRSTARVITTVSFLMAVFLLFTAGRMRTVRFDCSGASDGQVILDGRADSDSCKQPVYLSPNAMVEWRTSLGMHAPVRVDKLRDCRGQLLLCSDTYTIRQDEIGGVGPSDCAPPSKPRTWRVEITSPRGSPSAAYLRAWSSDAGATLRWGSKCSVLEGRGVVVLNRGQNDCWNRSAPNFVAQLSGCFSAASAKPDLHVVVSASLDDLEDPCTCE